MVITSGASRPAVVVASLSQYPEKSENSPAMVLVDGNRLPVLDVPAEAIVKGDALVPAISAASILAKVHRDRWCAQVHDEFPQYGFAGHKGYGTAVHMAALREHGACIYHRRSFAPVAQNLRAGS